MGDLWTDYKDLMRRTPEHLITGVSYMVPTVVAGGLIFSFAIILWTLKRNSWEAAPA